MFFNFKNNIKAIKESIKQLEEDKVVIKTIEELDAMEKILAVAL